MNNRDIELLSAYLDGELKPSDSIKLEARLKTDPELASVLNDLRVTRTLLHKLPSRKAPRNFTLTRKMVGLNPPLPRTYPIFRLATVVATLLFFFSFAANAFSVQLAQPYNFGRGGGGGGEEAQSYAAAPAATEAPAEPALGAPAAAPVAPEVAPTATLAPQGTMVPPAEDATRIMVTPSEKNAGEGGPVTQDQAPVQSESLTTSVAQEQSPLIPSTWQIGLAVVAVVSALWMGLMRQLSTRHWK